ncbi:MAG: ABC transporter ATP-binding protein [Verrucomicrobia bacterium]|nr:ABC transporter ATP-binding protein [Verrucomicrobiota bacterium]
MSENIGAEKAEEHAEKSKSERGFSDPTSNHLSGPATTLDTKTGPSLPYLFEAVGIAKKFEDGQVHALRGVNLRVMAGEFIAVIGPSGCGKTTLLQMLGALDRPTKGTLLYRGNSIPDLRDPWRYRALEIGFIFQAFHLLPTFTALENVQIPMFENHLSAAERKDRAVGLLKSVGLKNRLDHFPAKLSGGERQRVAIARSLANSPSVLLADEPTGNLDSENAHLILELIARLHHEQNMTLVLVTHDIGIAQRASRIIQMKDGRIVTDSESIIVRK